MSALIAVVMAALVVTLGVGAVRGAAAGWVLVLSAVLAGGPILLAALRTVPNARRLGARSDPLEVQHRLAGAILRDHLVCLAGMSAFLVLWLVAG
jgi:hypothetical protein